ncbi:MAG: hypothetical protein CL525_00210 [Aequorivita sp.]|nr:hypothetical protein [Aequorivita sp.]MBF29552.1 hypothetical protein [Aequorivita sp.]|tara:strand:+ start:270181 stop:270531 length:351 start_codon:yes stop_codon:yes gene_type:complete
MKKWIYRISILFNILFIIGFGLNWFNSPTYKLGRLEKDVQIGVFSSDSIIFTIPKGLTVRNISECGLSAIGQFENERFEIVITSDNPDLVNYDIPRDSLQSFGNFYSADLKNYSGK